MCGITGIFGLEKLDRPKEIVQNMNKVLAHRGPDFDGIFEDENVVLGHRRLSIIDLSSEANQPFISSDGRYVLAFNGEVYNFKSIKDKIKKYQFKTKSDTEVVLASFIEFGMECFHWFNGMFALAIWDTQEQELTLARDRMGIKPLYYTHVDQSIVFSSEIRPILQSGLIEAKIDHEGLVDYFRYQTVHAPRTIIEGVHMLPAGTVMNIKDNDQSLEKFWDIRQRVIPDENLSKDAVNKEIKKRLFEAVERRTIADVPYGAFLSGGIDSSAIVGLMAQLKNTQINTFSVTFDESEFSEAKYARMVAEKYGTNHNEIPVSPENFLELLPDALKAMDHPSGDGPNTYVVSKVTKDSGVTMALSGLGGDELFAGYELFNRCVSLSDKKWLTSFPSYLRKPLGAAYRKLKPGISSTKIAETLSLDYFDLEYIYPIMRQVYVDSDILKISNFDKLPQNRVFEIAKEVGYSNGSGTLPYLSRISYMELNTYMQNVLLRDSDQMSMAHALEIRVPFLDHELIEFVMGINDKLKYPSSPKKLLVESLAGILPDEVVNRPKMGFTFPWAQWMKKELRSFCEINIERLKSRSFINAEHLDLLWKYFLNDNPLVNWSRLWGLIVLENWLNENNIKA